MNKINLEVHSEGVVFFHINDPVNKNAIDDEFCLQLYSIVETIKKDKSIKVIILTGLPDIFCTGGTEAFLQSLITHYKTNIEHEYANHLKHLLDIPIPVIAAMEGSATGGGLILGLYADILIAAEESRYGLSFMNMGFTPGMGSTAMSQAAFGYYTGFEMMVTGNYLKGNELKGKCCFNYILPRAEVLDKAIELATAIAEKPRHSLELLKKYLSIERRKALEETSTIEAFMHHISFNQLDIEKNLHDNYTG
ncbi:polyketide synthase [Edaphovirga cremea]|uniref:polyketide synthase n=1 Tax=Edaphovirga cremea TaxID=2267246 RepID=UPI000DEEDFCE|nr:polyketide synthase [Edaphovirga cremea]